MRIQHNIPAMNAYRNFKANNSGLSKNLEKLSSGYKINRAGDDAAGLAISEKMRAQISGLEVASKNAKDGISLVQTAEGALTEVHDMLNRMVTLAEQSANGTYSDDVDRAQLQKEVDQLREEINRIADSANFNGIKLLDGSMDSTNAIAATSTTTITTNFAGKPTTFATSDIADIAVGSNGKYVDGTLGEKTIFHKEAPTAGKSSFTVNLNNYTVDKEGAFGIKLSTGSASKPISVAITASDVASGVVLSGSDLAAKIVEAAATTDSEGIDVNRVTIGSTAYDISADGNKLNFVAVDKGAKAVDMSVTVTGNTFSTTPATGATTGVAISFAWASDVSGENMEKMAGASLNPASRAPAFTVSVQQKAAALATSAVVASKMEAVAGFDGDASFSVEIVGNTIKFTNNAVGTKTLNTTNKLNLTYNGYTVELTLAQLGLSSNAAISADGTKTIGSTDVLGALSNSFGIKSQGADASDTVTITFPANAGAAGSLPAGFEIRNASGTKITTATLAGNASATTYTIYDGSGSSANKVGTFTVDLSKVDAELKTVTNKTTAYYSSAANAASTVAASHFVVTDAAGVAPKISTTAGGAGTGDYNTSTEINVMGADVAGTRLASTKIDLTVFNGKIKDGAALTIGEQTYIFAVGSKSTLQDSANGKLVDLKDLGTSTGATALTGDELKTAIERLTVAAKDNTMFGVGFDKTTSGSEKITLVEREDYYNGSNVLLNTKKAIADQLAWGEVKSKNGQTASTSTTAARVAKDLTLQIGDTAESFNQLTVSIKDMHTKAMGVLGSDGKVVSGKSLADIDVSNQDGAQEAVDIIKSAINYVSDMRGTLGATQNRLDHTINNLSVMVENITDAESTIRDTDIAEEMMTYTKNSILNQAAQAMLAQANQLPQGVLQLLQ